MEVTDCKDLKYTRKVNWMTLTASLMGVRAPVRNL